VQRLILTNAAGSLERVREPGTWMVVSDQINLTGASPLEGPAFVEMGEVYGAGLRRRLGEEATRLGLRWSEGVYVGLRGPQSETPAEVRMLRGLGGDAVGMSTVLEAIAARAAGMEVAGISRITNFGAGLGGPLSHAEVVEVGGAGAAELGDWLGAVLARGGG
jgi:purine-nucleoside phosphorylase